MIRIREGWADGEPLRVGLVSLGCPKNRVDSEVMLGSLKEDFLLTADPDQADVIIVNTCAFIENACQEAVDTILEMAARKERHLQYLVVTGCLPERYRQQVRERIPEVDLVTGTRDYGRIRELLRDLIQEERRADCLSDNEDLRYLDGPRIRTTTGVYAYLKIAEGCSHGCTYCAIPRIRGRYRSRPAENLLAEAGRMAEEGIRELILVAQDTTLYGFDLYGKRTLPELINRLSEIRGIDRIRVLYGYPDGLTDDLAETFLSNRKLCAYLDLPLQHASEEILRRMGRPMTTDQVRERIGKLRDKVPGMTLRTTFITGFPGETEEDVEILRQFMAVMRFDRAGVFVYSPEEGTPAARMERQISAAEGKRRRNRLMAAQQEISLEIQRHFVGQELDVYIDALSDDSRHYIARSCREAPEIDGAVLFPAQNGSVCRVGEKATVRVVSATAYDLYGEELHESAD